MESMSTQTRTRRNLPFAKLHMGALDRRNSRRRKRPATTTALVVALSVVAAILLDGTAVVPRFSRSSIGADARPYSFTWPTLVSLAEAYKVDGMDGHEHERAAATSKSAIHDNEESTETETTTRTRHFESQSQSDSESFDEDILVQETIEAGRGDRDEHGIRDQWESDEHLNDKFDSRKPISSDVLRLLKAYRLECEGCDHRQAVRTVNAYVRETKRLVEAERLARERRDLWARRIFGTLAVVVVSCAFFYKDRLSRFLGVDAGRGARDDFDGFSEAQKAELVRMRREHAARAATQRQQPQQPAPTWLDNEQKEVWTSKQEKQFQTALREFSGVPKKDRYRLIAEKVQGKSRIECLTHHRMQELLKKREQSQQ